MNQYAKINEGSVVEFPLTEYQIKAKFPNTSFVDGLFLLPDGYVEVVRSTPPEIGWDEKLTILAPTFHDPFWVENYQVDKISQEEKDEIITQLKANKNAEINQSRLTANNTSFTFMGKEIAVDDMSTKDIVISNGIISATGELPPMWPGVWKTMDNTFIPIASVSDWKAFYLAMYNQGLVNFIKSQTLKTQLYRPECNTPELIELVKW